MSATPQDQVKMSPEDAQRIGHALTLLRDGIVIPLFEDVQRIRVTSAAAVTMSDLERRLRHLHALGASA